MRALSLLGREIRNLIFSSKFIFLFCISIIITIIMINTAENKEKLDINKQLDYNFQAYNANYSFYNSYDEELFLDTSLVYQNLYNALNDNNSKEYYYQYLMIFGNDVKLIIESEYNVNDILYDYSSEHLNNIYNNIYKDNEDPVAFLASGPQNTMLNIAAIYTKQHYYCYENNVEIIMPNTINSRTFIYQFIRNVMPIILLLSSFVLTTGNISSDLKNGICKIYMSTNMKKVSYIIIKLLSIVFVSIFIILSTMIIFQIYYFVTEGNYDIDITVLIYEYGLTNLLNPLELSNVGSDGFLNYYDQILISNVPRIDGTGRYIDALPLGINTTSNIMVILLAITLNTLCLITLILVQICFEINTKKLGFGIIGLLGFIGLEYLTDLLIPKFSLIDGLNPLSLIEGFSHTTFFAVLINVLILISTLFIINYISINKLEL